MILPAPPWKGLFPIRRFFSCALALALGSAQPVGGQSPSSGVASLEALVTDSLSGRPILRVLLWNIRSTDPQHKSAYYVKADTTGRPRLDSIPAGRPQHFQAVCEESRFRHKLLDSMTITLDPGEVRQWTVRTATRGCDQRPFLVHRGVVEGRWRYGFEESRFQPCDSLLPEAWVGFAPDAQRSSGVTGPKGLDQKHPEVFARFEGVLVGPWSYGHLGVSDYQLTVSRILTVRKPSRAQCGR